MAYVAHAVDIFPDIALPTPYSSDIPSLQRAAEAAQEQHTLGIK